MLGFPLQANAQTLQDNGLYAGTFWVNSGKFPISYFLESLHQVDLLKGLIDDPVVLDAFSKGFLAYDGIMITAHPDSVSEMKINSTYATFAQKQFIEEISRGITKSSEIEKGCITLPFGAISAEGKFVTYSIFVYSDDGKSISDRALERCLRASANHLF